MAAGLPGLARAALMTAMTRPADSASRLALGLGVAGAAALAAITLADPGATRMHAWPWSLAYALALLAPAAALVLRAYAPTHPLRTPSQPWFHLVLAGGAAVLVSAFASPYRGPGLLGAAPLLSALALFLVTFDWLHADPAQGEARRRRLRLALGGFLVLVALASLGRWLGDLPRLAPAEIFAARNPHPLGHSNYTAGLALLMLPTFAALARSANGRARLGWAAAAVLALGLLFTSGSRGGLGGLAVLLLGALLASRLGVRRTLGFAALAAAACLLLALAHPRTRALLHGADAAALSASTVQRTAMARAGFALGAARPLLGWGPGATPLAYPKFRAGLDGGVEDALQLHSLPVQLWAELGLAGLAGLAGLLVFIARHARRDPTAAVTLAGYLAFALTDYQLDVPVFAFSLAILAALLAPPADPATAVRSRALDWCLRLTALAYLAFARTDPTPAMNVHALALARDPAQTPAAAELLRTSLAVNPDQEIAHFNLGWLQVVNQPDEAERHFLAAARLVPDKGGVYFGLGLARLNQGRQEEAARALALECLNDPVFLVSPWWRNPALQPLRPGTLAILHRFLAEAAGADPLKAPAAAKELAYTAALVRWIEGTAAPGEMLAAANTAERTAFFARRPPRPAFADAPVSLLHRERTGYPVLMRNLDLPTPVDLFAVQENALAVGEYRFLFPQKGWLPAPLLLGFLQERLQPQGDPIPLPPIHP